MTAPLTYLSMDSLDEGIGASQVLAYVERFAERGIEVRLHSFEKGTPATWIEDRLGAAGVRWLPRPFGRMGAVGGMQRILAGARAVRGAELVHARSDLAAAAALLGRPDRWVWDVRSLWADQKIELGELRTGSPEERVLRYVERSSARRADAVVTLTEAVIPELVRRHGPAIADKTTVVTTCVDTSRFVVGALPPAPPLRFLLAGTVNGYYDVPLMVALVEAAGRRGDVAFDLVTPGPSRWDGALAPVTTTRRSATPPEMAGVVAACHVGLSVCRDDAGVSLLGSMPTKIGEFLASGRPLVVNPGLGDAGRLLPERGCGVAVADASPAELTRALDALEELVADPETPARCRAFAEEHFDLDRGVDALVRVYERLGS